MAPSASRLALLARDAPCGAIAHPWCPESCTRGVAVAVTSAAVSSFPLLLCFHLGKLTLRIYSKGCGPWRDETWLLADRVANMVVFACVFFGGTVGFMCLSRRLLGKFTYETVIFVPTLVSAICATSHQSPRNLRIIIDTSFVLAVEGVVRIALGKFRQNHKFQLALKVTLFSLMSGLLGFLQRTDLTGSHVPWLHWPERDDHIRANFSSSTDETQTGPLLYPSSKDWRRKGGFESLRLLLKKWITQSHVDCKHRGPCLSHVTRGLLSFGMFGGVLSLLSGIISKGRAWAAGHSAERFKLLNWRFPGFLATFVAVFRMVRCWLCWRNGKDSPEHCATAGFIAGLTVVFNPSTSLFAAALASTIELCWRRAVQNGLVPKSLSNHPVLVAALSIATFTHIVVHDRGGKNTPTVATFLLAGYSGGKAMEMLRGYRRIVASGLSSPKILN